MFLLLVPYNSNAQEIGSEGIGFAHATIRKNGVK